LANGFGTLGELGMRGEPPQRLTSLLDELHLATADQVRSMHTRVRRLAGEFPDFESVWVDALAQARVITPYQAAEINAGRGELLACGDYVINGPLPSPAYAECFSAEHQETGREVRLYLARHGQGDLVGTDDALAELVARSTLLRRGYRGAAEAAGRRGNVLWAACEPLRGMTAGQWMAENGRLPAEAVMSIAREMLELLAQLERHSIVHGDVGALGLVLVSGGGVALPMPGLRGVVRPGEGYSFNDLTCAAYDYLSPERIGRGGPPTVQSDLYACGCLWWHLLTGRAPFGGGNSLSKLKAAHAARWVDIRQMAPQTPELLSAAISWCIARDPNERPHHAAELLETLGPASRGDGRCVTLALERHPWHAEAEGGERRPRRRVVQLAGACLVAFAAMLAARGMWPANRGEISIARAIPIADQDARPLREASSSESVVAQVPSPRATMQLDERVARATAIDSVDLVAARSLLLPANQPNDSTELEIAAGMTVRGAEGNRPTVLVRADGLAIDVDDVCFENVDFVWQPTQGETSPNDRMQSMFRVRANGVSWRGCTLNGRKSGVVAIVVAAASSELSRGAVCELSLSDCVVSGVTATVDGIASLSLGNTLCVASGPLLRIPRGAGHGDAISVSLDHVTLRGEGSILEWRYGRRPSQPNAVTISVTESVLDTGPHEGLVVFAGSERPEPLLQSIQWNGQGSVVGPRTTIASWRSGETRHQALSDDALEIAGLVRSDVEFAGKPEGPPSASRVTRWHGPLRSAEPPGISAAALPQFRK
jgi:hypothetical protein